MEPKKKWWQSKTLWFNIATGIVAVSQFIPTPFTLAAAVVGNIVLRTMTNAPIENPITKQ